MKRSQRLAPVQQVLDGTERDRAREMGTAQRSLGAAELRLQELQNYHAEYLKAFQRTAAAGGNALALRDFQIFLGKLEEAIRQQEQIVYGARQGVAGSTRLWQSAARRVKAVESVVDKWRGDEHRHESRLEQKDTDEHAQRRPARAAERET
ncbi:MAG: flagellar export protein FliJ [Steroidobacteraceae bacterium]